MNRSEFNNHLAQLEKRGLTPEERREMGLEERRDYEEFAGGDLSEQMGLSRDATWVDLKRKIDLDKLETEKEAWWLQPVRPDWHGLGTD